MKQGRLMKPYQIYKSTLWIIIVISLLFNVVLAALLLRSRPQFKLIAIEDGRARWVTESQDVILKDEEVRFLKTFLKKYYTLNPDTVSDFKDSLFLIEANFYKQIEAYTKELIQKVEANELQERIHILEINENNGIYRVKFEKEQIMRGERTVTKHFADVELIRVNRSEALPWGLLVKTFKEKQLL
jgi:mRNA-degrading endonuclease RelE of RelBE toxin-antitoxin system